MLGSSRPGATDPRADSHHRVRPPGQPEICCGSQSSMPTESAAPSERSPQPAGCRSSISSRRPFAARITSRDGRQRGATGVGGLVVLVVDTDVGSDTIVAQTTTNPARRV